MASIRLSVLAMLVAMQLAVDEAAAADHFSPDEILPIHGRLMERWPAARVGGRFRAVQNWIGGNDYNPSGADFVAPPPEYVPDLLADLCQAIDDDLLPPLVQAAIVHGQFETIHPFDVGNGRTGRALIDVVLRHRGVTPAYVPPISVVLAGSKDRHIRGLVDFRNGEFEAWIDQFAAVTVRAGRLAAQYLDAVADLIGQWRERLAVAPDAPRADTAAWAIIDLLPAHPIVTGSVAAAATGRSKPQVYRALEQLEAAGILERVSKGRRNRSWEAAGLLDLIESLEAGELPAAPR